MYGSRLNGCFFALFSPKAADFFAKLLTKPPFSDIKEPTYLIGSYFVRTKEATR